MIGCAAGFAQSSPNRQQELVEIRQQIDQLRGRLTVMRSKEAGLEDEVRRVGVELQLQQAELEEASAAVALATAEAAEASDKIVELEGSLEQVRADLQRRLSGLYRLGGRGYLRLFLALRPDQDLLPAVRQLRYLARRDERSLERFADLKQQLEEQQERLEAQRLAMAEWQAEEQERRDALVVVKRRQEQVLARVAKERRRLAARTDELLDKERKLTRFIHALTSGAEQLDGAPIQDFSGVLDWPARGKVSLEFGPRRDPRYGTQVPHNGIDLATVEGAEVRVVFPGEVLFSAEFEGYGPMVVVHHPGRVFTLYAGLSNLRVGKGGVVSLGEVLGTATDTLYFEIRVENQPQDPRRWLR